MDTGNERITMTMYRDLLRRFCRERGLLVKEGERGMYFRMPDGTMLLLYAVPMKLFSPTHVRHYYGRFYRDGVSYRDLDGRAALTLYRKLKDAMKL